MQRGKVVLSGCPQVNFINKNNFIYLHENNKNISFSFQVCSADESQICTGLENIPIPYSCN